MVCVYETRSGLCFEAIPHRSPHNRKTLIIEVRIIEVRLYYVFDYWRVRAINKLFPDFQISSNTEQEAYISFLSSRFPEFFIYTRDDFLLHTFHINIFVVTLTVLQRNLSSCSCGFFLVFPTLCCWFCLLITALRIERNIRLRTISCQNSSS